MITSNPWDVASITDFACLKCPECTFDTKEEENFREHAIENHPSSLVFFGQRPENEFIDIIASEVYSVEENHSAKTFVEISDVENLKFEENSSEIPENFCKFTNEDKRTPLKPIKYEEKGQLMEDVANYFEQIDPTEICESKLNDEKKSFKSKKKDIRKYSGKRRIADECKESAEEYLQTSDEYQQTTEDYKQTAEECKQTAEEYNQTVEDYFGTAEECKQTAEVYEETAEECRQTITSFDQDENDSVFLCRFCNAKFTMKCNLRRHIRLNRSVRPSNEMLNFKIFPIISFFR